MYSAPVHRKGDTRECSNSRCIGLLSVVGKLYYRALIKKVRAGTECAIGEEQCGFRQRTKCLSKGKCVKSILQIEKLCSGRLWIWKRHDTIDRHGMWQMLRVYGALG